MWPKNFLQRKIQKNTIFIIDECNKSFNMLVFVHHRTQIVYKFENNNKNYY